MESFLVPAISPFTDIRWNDTHNTLEVLFRESPMVPLSLIMVDDIHANELVAFALATDRDSATLRRFASHFLRDVATLAARKGTATFLATGHARVIVFNRGCAAYQSWRLPADSASFNEAILREEERLRLGLVPRVVLTSLPSGVHPMQPAPVIATEANGQMQLGQWTPATGAASHGQWVPISHIHASFPGPLVPLVPAHTTPALTAPPSAPACAEAMRQASGKFATPPPLMEIQPVKLPVSTLPGGPPAVAAPVSHCHSIAPLAPPVPLTPPLALQAVPPSPLPLRPDLEHRPRLRPGGLEEGEPVHRHPRKFCISPFSFLHYDNTTGQLRIGSPSIGFHDRFLVTIDGRGVAEIIKQATLGGKHEEGLASLVERFPRHVEALCAKQDALCFVRTSKATVTYRRDGEEVTCVLEARHSYYTEAIQRETLGLMPHRFEEGLTTLPFTYLSCDVAHGVLRVRLPQDADSTTVELVSLDGIEVAALLGQLRALAAIASALGGSNSLVKRFPQCVLTAAERTGRTCFVQTGQCNVCFRRPGSQGPCETVRVPASYAHFCEAVAQEVFEATTASHEGCVSVEPCNASPTEPPEEWVGDAVTQTEAPTDTLSSEDPQDVKEGGTVRGETHDNIDMDSVRGEGRPVRAGDRENTCADSAPSQERTTGDTSLGGTDAADATGHETVASSGMAESVKPPTPVTTVPLPAPCASDSGRTDA